jgi:hypothetical protein
MGRGSSDPILNRYMPTKAVLNVPNIKAVAESQQCRNTAESLACKNLIRSFDSLMAEAIQLVKSLDEARRIVEAKIKAYEEEF